MWKTFSIDEPAFCRRTVLRVGALWPYVLPVAAAFGGGGGGKMCMRRNYRRGVVRFHYSSVLLTVVTRRDTLVSATIVVPLCRRSSFSKETRKDDVRASRISRLDRGLSRRTSPAYNDPKPRRFRRNVSNFEQIQFGTNLDIPRFCFLFYDVRSWLIK